MKPAEVTNSLVTMGNAFKSGGFATGTTIAKINQTKRTAAKPPATHPILCVLTNLASHRNGAVTVILTALTNRMKL